VNARPSTIGMPNTSNPFGESPTTLTDRSSRFVSPPRCTRVLMSTVSGGKSANATGGRSDEASADASAPMNPGAAARFASSDPAGRTVATITSRIG